MQAGAELIVEVTAAGYAPAYWLEQDGRSLSVELVSRGLAVAEVTSKSGDDAEAYAMEVVKSDFEEAGDEDVFRKVRGDLDAAGVEMSDEDLRDKMVDLMNQAVEEVENEG